MRVVLGSGQLFNSIKHYRAVAREVHVRAEQFPKKSDQS